MVNYLLMEDFLIQKKFILLIVIIIITIKYLITSFTIKMTINSISIIFIAIVKVFHFYHYLIFFRFRINFSALEI